MRTEVRGEREDSNEDEKENIGQMNPPNTDGSNAGSPYQDRELSILSVSSPARITYFKLGASSSVSAVTFEADLMMSPLTLGKIPYIKTIKS